MGEHWTAKWVGILSTVGLTVLGFASTVIWYFEDDRVRQIQWRLDDAGEHAAQLASLNKIDTRLGKIQTELATQTQRLDDLVGYHVEARSDRERLDVEITDLRVSVAGALGHHRGEHGRIESTADQLEAILRKLKIETSGDNPR